MNGSPKQLRAGFSTGTAAAAATKAALTLLITGTPPGSVIIPFLSSGHAVISPIVCKRTTDNTAYCEVRKDAGDDPDITHKAIIAATVSIDTAADTIIDITGGIGVGRVTRPGLELPVGAPAINPGPSAMIRAAIMDVLEKTRITGRVKTEISVPCGEVLARNTLNHRLGITGGISILGTTGIVTPLSHEAYMATIRSAISVAAAQNLPALVFTTGRRSEKMAMELWNDLPEPAFIQMGDFVAFSVRTAMNAGFTRLRFGLFFGKTVKIAMGYPQTHAARSTLSLDWLTRQVPDHLPELRTAIETANSARHALAEIQIYEPGMIRIVLDAAADSLQTFADNRAVLEMVLFDFDGTCLAKTTRSPGEDIHA